MTTIEFKVTGSTETEIREAAERELEAFVGPALWPVNYTMDVTGTTYVGGQGASQVVLYEGTVRAEW